MAGNSSDHNRERSLLVSIALNLAFGIVSILLGGVVFTDKIFDQGQRGQIFAWYSIFACVVVLLLLLIETIRAIRDLVGVWAQRRIAEAAEQTRNYLIQPLAGIVPNRLTIKHRHDILEILDKTTARLTWDWTLESEWNKRVSELVMPIEFELPKDCPPDMCPISFLQASVGKTLVDLHDCFQAVHTVEHVQSKLRLQRGHVTIKLVGFGSGQPSITMRVEMLLTGVFPNAEATPGEVLFVDVAHPTKHLTVEVKVRDKQKRVQPATHPAIKQVIIPESLLTYDNDTESIDVLQNAIDDRGHGIVWQIDNPKYAYRYKLHFQVVDAPKKKPKGVVEKSGSCDPAAP